MIGEVTRPLFPALRRPGQHFLSSGAESTAAGIARSPGWMVIGIFDV